MKYTLNQYVKLICLFLLVVVSIGGGVKGCIYYWNMWKSNISIKSGKSEFLLIYENDQFFDVIRKLETSGVMKSVESFKKMALKQNYPQNILPGRYELNDGMGNYKLLHKLKTGRQTPIRITFNNIRTQENLAHKLSKQLMIDSLQIITILNDEKVLAEYGLNPETSVCLFIPNTYEVYWDISPENLLKRMKKEYDIFWTEDRLMKLGDVGLNRVEVCTLASIVEEESNKKEEKTVIAGLYLNRLNKGMLLQADPTVKFAINDFSLKRIRGVLSYDSPYNTYKYTGLPPGPIRIPSIESIDAVLNYQPHNYIYMCAKEDFSGYHYFTSSFQEHEKNRAKYIREVKKRGIEE